VSAFAAAGVEKKVVKLPRVQAGGFLLVGAALIVHRRQHARAQQQTRERAGRLGGEAGHPDGELRRGRRARQGVEE
jgi:hypothetical protein